MDGVHPRLGDAAGCMTTTTPTLGSGMLVDALRLTGNGPVRRGDAWHTVLALSPSRIMLAAGEIAGLQPTVATVTRELHELFGPTQPAASAATETRRVADFLRARCAAGGGSAILGIVDLSAHTFTYSAVGQPPPCVRYHDGTQSTLPPVGQASAGGALAQTVVDLRGAASLVLATRGLHAIGDERETKSWRLGQALTDERFVQHAQPAAWLARHLLADRSHDSVALMVLTFPISAGRVAAGRLPRWSVSWTFEATGARSNDVRRLFIDCLISKQHPDRPIDLAASELIFGELLGNVVRYAPGQVDVTLDWTGTLPLLHVLDRGPGFRWRRGRERLPVDELSESGRGLFIINACAAKFRVTSRKGHGTHATAALPLLGSIANAGSG